MTNWPRHFARIHIYILSVAVIQSYEKYSQLNKKHHKKSFPHALGLQQFDIPITWEQEHSIVSNEFKKANLPVFLTPSQITFILQVK